MKEARESLKKAVDLKSYYRNKVTFIRVAEADGKLVGILLCYLPPHLSIPLCWITWIGVRKSFRRIGVGSMLLRSLETQSRGRWHRIQCRVRVTNVPSNRLFARAGYVRVKYMRRKIRKRDSYKWEKKLGTYPHP